MNWRNGLNFKRAKYYIIKSNVFIPYIHSDLKATIPIEILKNFVNKKSNDLVALLKITDKVTRKTTVRVKKLYRNGQSLAFSLEKEKDIKEPIIEVLDIKSEKECLTRVDGKFLNLEKSIPTLYVLPSYTLNYSFPYTSYQKMTPLFVFKYRNNLYCGSHYGWKNLILKDEIIPNEFMSAVIGLYFAEGGKTTASFTNSQPTMINLVLDFVEEMTNIKRSSISANIYCHPNLANKKRNLEDFWSSETGITKFSSHLHLSENSKSPCGTLEINFSSIILKEFLCGLSRLAFNIPSIIEPKSLVRGIFSAEASPIRQTKTYITHHITLNRHNWKIEFEFINSFVSQLGIKLAKVPVNPTDDSKQIHAVVYSDWLTNLKILLLDVYHFNLFNREKFAKQFLSLPQTKLFLELEEGDTVTGREIIYNKGVLSSERRGLIILKQISPKPNKKYEIQFTEMGLKLKETLQHFINKVYPTYLENVKKFYKTLQKFDLLPKGV